GVSSCSTSKSFPSIEASAKDLLPRSLDDGGHCRVRKALIDGDGIELLLCGLGVADDVDVVPAPEFGLEHRGRREESLALLSEGVHEGAVVELGHQRRMHAHALEPLIETAPH